MKKYLSAILAAALLMSALASLTSCGDATGPGGDPNQNSDALKKYDSPITVKFLHHDDGSMPTMPDGYSWDKNQWTDAYLDELGVKIESVGVATSGEYDTKIAMMLSSNSLPDIFYCNNTTLKTFVLSDAVQEIGAYMDQYTTEDAKRYLNMDGGTSLNACMYDGKQYAIPQLRPLYDDQVNNICIRTDWLDNLGIPEPETWQDILDIIEAFATKDPDKNGKNDTYGIGIDKEAVDGVIRGVSDLQGFFAAYRTYPGRWIDGPDGSIIYGTVQPGIKKPLAVLRDFYKKGYIDPDYENKSQWDVRKDIVAGKIGLSFTVNWGAVNYMDIYEELEDKLKFYPIPSEDGKKTQLYVKNWMAEGSKIVVNKNFANPEVIYKLFSFEIDKALSTGEEFKKLFKSTDGLIPVKFMIASMGTAPDHGQKSQKDIMKVLDSDDPNPEKAPVYIREGVEKILKCLDGDWTDVEAWGNYMTVYGDNSTTGVINYYLDNGIATMDRFTGAPTDTMWKKGSILQWEGIGAFNYIITGKEPIEYFDTFVENWMQKGGEKLISEVNAWWETEKAKG